MKIAYQGVAGSYSESCAKEKYPDCETIPCKTFDECFEKANNDSLVKAIIPESNKTTGNIGVEYLIFKYRLNIFAEHFFPN
jgi:Prephenate dehydratase